MLFNLFLALIVFSFAIMFLVGLIILIIGLLKKERNNSLIKKGLFLSGLPLSLALLIFLYNLFFSVFSSKPSQKDLVGIYYISETSGLDIDRSTFSKYKLEFRRDSSFTLTPTPYISVCDSGQYEVDYGFEDNELSFKCGNGFIAAHIDRRLGSFRIEFTIGDPDSGESIFFKKD